MENKAFYMVYLEGERTPTYKHPDYGSAMKEAQRLTQIYKKKAYILVTLSFVELDLFKVEYLRPDDENPLPF